MTTETKTPFDAAELAALLREALAFLRTHATLSAHVLAERIEGVVGKA